MHTLHEVETGRWRGVEREERVCRECSVDEIEDTCHWMISCPAWSNQRQPLIERARELIDYFEEMEIESKTASILDPCMQRFKDCQTIMYAMWCE